MPGCADELSECERREELEKVASIPRTSAASGADGIPITSKSISSAIEFYEVELTTCSHRSVLGAAFFSVAVGSRGDMRLFDFGTRRAGAIKVLHVSIGSRLRGRNHGRQNLGKLFG